MKGSVTLSNPPAKTLGETVLATRHYTDRLFVFRTTRAQSFRFRSGEFAMLGLETDGKPLLRAYSIASPSWSDELEFVSIKVPNGPLTSKLAKVKPGDQIILKPRTTGTLVLDALLPGRTLWLVSTGTGIAPFASIVRDPQTYEDYEHVFLTHTCRENAELAVGFDLMGEIAADPLVSEIVGDKLTHVPTVTREEPTEGTLKGRITHLVESGSLFDSLGVPPWSPENDRVMICGSTDMINDTKALCEKAGLTEGSNSSPGEYVVEKAFVG